MTITRMTARWVAGLLLVLLVTACGTVNTGGDTGPTPTSASGADIATPGAAPTLQEPTPMADDSQSPMVLGGTSWLVDNVTTSNESSIPPVEVTIDFNPDGTFGGSDGCNLYSGGSYTQAGDTLTVDLAVSPLTDRPCDQTITQFAERFFQVLGGTHQLSATEGTLILTREDGSSIRLVQRTTSGLGDGSDSGAAGGTQPAAQPLDGTQWRLVGYGPDGTTQPLGELTLTFANAQMSGFSGCNNFSAPYEIDGDRLVLIGDILSTLMACADDAMNTQERAILDALSTVTTATRESNTLTLTYEGGILQYAAMETDATALENQTWTLTTMLIGGDAAVSPSPQAPISMTIQDGRITGNTGCNEYFTDYRVDGSQLTLGALGTTRRACPDELGPQEQQFLQLFRTVNGYRLEGPQLTLLAGDVPVLVFTITEAMP